VKLLSIQILAGLLLLQASARAEESPVDSVTATEVYSQMRDGDVDLVLLDVRTPEEFAAGHVPSARNVPHDRVIDRPAELAEFRDREVVVYCRSGRRAAAAIEALRAAGVERVRHLDGDMPGWEAAQLPVETPPSAETSPAKPL